MSARQAEKAMNEILRDLHRQNDADYVSIRNWLCTLMYTTGLYEDDAVRFFKQFCEFGTLPALNQYL